MRSTRFIVGLIAAAILTKLCVFLYIIGQAPQTVVCIDSHGYLRDAQAWMNFFHAPSAGLRHSFYRTPGYTFFLAVFHGLAGIPLAGIVLLQLALNILSAIIVYKMLAGLGPWTGLLGAAIVLLDLPTTVYSTMILTESLHLFFITLFLFSFIKYMDNRKLKWLAVAGLFLGTSIYVRPAGYYLGFAVAGFIVYLWGMGKARTGIRHALLFLFIIYAFLAVWEYHNMKTPPYREFALCNIDNATVKLHGLFGSYGREKNPHLKQLPPAAYYVVSTLRHFFSLMTTPGDMKYLGSKAWRLFGAVFGYLLVIVWWIGLAAGIFKDKKDDVYKFLALVILYFVCVTIVAIGWGVGARFRVPMVTALAILSARGWRTLIFRA
ncbi:MAG: glycosyltransferase family 39 protein [Candidatus Omnitrophica bacterium]|nr:glycosyltransferase family 39 protein [Candidatus Omnitrophota bacterium]